VKSFISLNGTAFVLTDGGVRKIDNHHLVAEIRCGRFDARKAQDQDRNQGSDLSPGFCPKNGAGMDGRIIFDV